MWGRHALGAENSLFFSALQQVYGNLPLRQRRVGALAAAHFRAEHYGIG
jgi:hypothetical protein